VFSLTAKARDRPQTFFKRFLGINGFLLFLFFLLLFLLALLFILSLFSVLGLALLFGGVVLVHGQQRASVSPIRVSSVQLPCDRSPRPISRPLFGNA